MKLILSYIALLLCVSLSSAADPLNFRWTSTTSAYVLEDVASKKPLKRFTAELANAKVFILTDLIDSQKSLRISLFQGQVKITRPGKELLGSFNDAMKSVHFDSVPGFGQVNCAISGAVQGCFAGQQGMVASVFPDYSTPKVSGKATVSKIADSNNDLLATMLALQALAPPNNVAPPNPFAGVV